MPVPYAPPVRLVDEERTQLESLVRAHATPQALAFRCRLILRAAAPEWCASPCVEQQRGRGVERRAFLSDPTPQQVLHLTPTQGSWLTQVAWWFRVLARRLLQRGDCCAPDDFATRLVAYLDVSNTHHAHPSRWT